MYKPFPSQQKRIDSITEFINSGSNKKPIFVMPVGYGKSIVIANVAINFPNKYFINLAPNKELVYQNYLKYTSYGFSASICSSSLNSKEVSKVTFGTIGTLKSYVDFYEDKDVVLLVDEAHNASLRGGELDTFIKALNNVTVVGVTATPMRLDPSLSGSKLTMMNRQRKCLYTSIQDVVQVSEVIEEGRWSKLIYDVENVNEDVLELNTTGSDYTVKTLAKFSKANNIVDKCVQSVRRLREEGRKDCIVYVSSIGEAEEVCDKLEDSAVLHSKMKDKDRTLVVNDFLKGRLATIVNVSILKQGFDKPMLSSIVLARPTNSYSLYYQVIGRAVRIHKDKKDAKVVDISGNYNRFGSIEDLSFENNKYARGWAAFSKDRLLTGYALGGDIVPTKQSLKEHYHLKLKLERSKSKVPSPRFTFGKHKGITVDAVKKKDEKYLFWIVDPKTKFEFRGSNGIALKKAIYSVLSLPS